MHVQRGGTFVDEDVDRAVVGHVHDAAKASLLTGTSELVVMASSPCAFVGDRRRFVVLAAFALLGTSNGAQWITFSPIVDETKLYFGITAYQVNMLTTVYVVAYVLLVFLNCIAFQRFGLRRGLIIAAAFNAVGAAWRVLALLAAPSYGMLVLSEFFCAIAQILLLSTPPLIAAKWFLAHERTVVTALTTNLLTLGIGIGMIMPPLMVTPQHRDESAFLNFFGAQTVWAVAALLLTVLGVPARPHSPPSFAADAMESSSQHHPLQSVRRLLRNPSFLLLSLLVAMVMGVVWGLSTVLPQVLLPFGVSEVLTGWMGFCNMASGALVSSVAGHFIDKRKAFKSSLVGLAFAFTLMLALWMLLLVHSPAASVASSFLCYICIGCCANTILPVSLELGVELTFPIQEQFSSSALLWFASVYNFIAVQVMSLMLGDSPTRHQAAGVLAMGLVSTFVGGLAALAMSPTHRRQQYEIASFSASSPVAASPLSLGPNA